MSLKTRIRGFTAWVNLRLMPYDHLMNNVLMDLLTGTNMKVLLESLTGTTVKRLDTFDGITQQQKITRVEWMVEELKKCKVIPDDVFVDSRLFAMRSGDQIFELLWRLVCHDVWFVWERAEYLQHEDNEVLCEVPFKWIPEPPPVKKKKATKTRKSLLSGFGASSLITEKIDEDETTVVPDSYDPFPRSDYMKQFKVKPKGHSKYPKAETCIMELVNRQLKTLHEGQRLNCSSIDDLVDSRVLCALVNSFIPNTFTTEVLLNDRWSVNLVLRTTEKLFYVNSPFDSEDLAEADNMSVCGFFCVFFMLAYKYRQSKAVVDRLEELTIAQRNKELECSMIPDSGCSTEELCQKQQLKREILHIKTAIQRMEKAFDTEFCHKWMEHVSVTVKEMHKATRQKIKERFDAVAIPRTISINDLCLSLVINLSLTNGSGFYLAEGKEVLTDGRKLVIRVKDSNVFVDNFSTKHSKDHVRKLLRLPLREVVDIDPKSYPKYELYFEALSKNRSMSPGSTFLYQVFPSSPVTWHKVFLKAVKDDELETVERMVFFFKTQPSFINCREQQTGNTALHLACKLGHYDMVEHLLENGANIDQKNGSKQTPLFSAVEGLQRHIAHLLIEWGCDVHAKALRGLTAFETVKNEEFRLFLINAYQHYSTVVPRMMNGDTYLLENLVKEHATHVLEFNNLRSRCINGSTLLHTAAYFGCIAVIRLLVHLGVDINLLDYKGATALHRARDTDTMKALMDLGASTNLEDMEGNTPLHVKCYGENGKPSELEAVEMLLKCGAKIDVRNNRSLLCIHCAAMQGRVDVINILQKFDLEGVLQTALLEEQGKMPPSVTHLAVANDCVDCAEWLLEHGFNFKEGEQDLLMQRILSEQIKLVNRGDAVKFLLEHGARAAPRYSSHNTALHYAASMSGGTDVLELLIVYGADLDVVNEEGATPLFFACQSNNQFAASTLIEHGANVRVKNLQGLTAFDFILDYDEWIECGYFSEEIRARLKAYSLKHARDLIRAITKKVKAPQSYWAQTPATTLRTTPGLGQVMSRSTMRSDSHYMLPPLPQQHSFLTF